MISIKESSSRSCSSSACLCRPWGSVCVRSAELGMLDEESPAWSWIISRDCDSTWGKIDRVRGVITGLCPVKVLVVGRMMLDIDKAGDDG